jgi:alpha-tubulin suppressor-like RCC1 family protein
MQPGFELPKHSPPTTKVTPKFCSGYYALTFLAADGSLWFHGGANGTSPHTKANPLCPRFERVGTNLWKDVAANQQIAVAQASDGTLWAWGHMPLLLTPGPPRQISAATNWVQMAVGRQHIVARNGQDEIWVMGMNAQGEIGIALPAWELTQLEGRWKSIAAGSWNTYGIKPDGTLWYWGMSHVPSGPRYFTEPTLLDASTNWHSIGASGSYFVGTKNDGTLWCGGRSLPLPLLGRGLPQYKPLFQLGTETNWASVIVGETTFLVKKRDGSWWGLDRGVLRFTKQNQLIETNQLFFRVPEMESAWVLHPGSSATFILDADGQVWTWGRRFDKPLGGNSWKDKLQRSVANAPAPFNSLVNLVGGNLRYNDPTRIWKIPEENRGEQSP